MEELTTNMTEKNFITYFRPEPQTALCRLNFSQENPINDKGAY